MGEINQADSKFCEYILTKDVWVQRSPLVILCEGKRKAFKELKSRSRSISTTYGGLDEYPDASFWKKTIPSEWKGSRPYFISCGDRSAVIQTYSNLIELNDKFKKLSKPSYLDDPEKLFILIDLDVNGTSLDKMCNTYQKDQDSQLKNTEEIYHEIYKTHPINTHIIDQSKIIITGWRHKECYFFEPDLYDDLSKKLPDTEIYYNNNKLSSIEEVYKDMIEAVFNDPGINQNFDNYLKERIKKFLSIPISEQNTLLNEFKKIHEDSEINSQEKRQLIEALLTMINAKNTFWETAISCKADENTSSKAAKENFLKYIAQFYAKSCNLSEQSNSTMYHIPQWVDFLYRKHKGSTFESSTL